MTPRQRQILDVVTRFRSRHGTSPTVREIARDVGISVATTQEHIDNMVAGQILQRPGMPRARGLQPGRAVGKARIHDV